MIYRLSNKIPSSYIHKDNSEPVNRKDFCCDAVKNWEYEQILSVLVVQKNWKLLLSLTQYLYGTKVT